MWKLNESLNGKVEGGVCLMGGENKRPLEREKGRVCSYTESVLWEG